MLFWGPRIYQNFTQHLNAIFERRILYFFTPNLDDHSQSQLKF